MHQSAELLKEIEMDTTRNAIVVYGFLGVKLGI